MRHQPGELINGKYRLVRLIGDGGMGSVFEARHEYLGTGVALKFLHPELTVRPGLVARFLQEARLSASIKSYHIAHVTDVDQAADGAAYLVMELLEGSSLQQILDREKVLTLPVALDYTLQILAGLEAAHAAGVVHRDLKPDNVFVVTTARGPLVKLLDFGIAKLRRSEEFQSNLTRPGVIMGTPEYMAPEQASSADSVDARADVYSVGAMLYEMLSGRRPAPGDDAQLIAAFVLGKKVTYLNQVAPTIPGGLADAVHQAMGPLPSQRFASVADFRKALLPYCGNLSLAGSLAATPHPSGDFASEPPPKVAPSPAAPSPGGGVAPTLPPEPEAPARPSPQATAAATPHAVAPTPQATAQADPWVPAQGAYQVPPFEPRAQPAPAPVHHAPAHHAPMLTPSPTRARPKRGFAIWLLLGMLVLTVGIVVIAFATAETEHKPPLPVSTASPVVEPIPTAVTAAVAQPTPPVRPVTIPPPIQPAEPVAPAPASKPSTKPQRPVDGGAKAEDAGATPTVPGLPPLPFPFPSSFPSALPPLPSALPPITLPSGFPPITIPGFPPAPAPAASK